MLSDLVSTAVIARLKASVSDEVVRQELIELFLPECRLLFMQIAGRAEAEPATRSLRGPLNEACLRLFELDPSVLDVRPQLLGIVAAAFRRLMLRHLPANGVTDSNGVDIVRICDELTHLHKIKPRHALIFELVALLQLTVLEVADLLGEPEPSVARSRRTAQAWIYSRISTHADTAMTPIDAEPRTHPA